MTASPHQAMNQLLSLPNQVGLVLRAARKSAKLNQKQLAAKLGLSQSRVSELETDPASMRVDQLLAVLAVLGLELQVQTRGGAPDVGEDGDTGAAPASKVEW
jgi:HTH-type transcriptional regulator/antitoxin HipB